MKIRLTPKCERDLKRLRKKHFNLERFQTVVEHIIKNDDDILFRVYKDHALKGNWQGFRECHIESDWLLIYRINKADNLCELVLTRTGSHDDLF